MSSTDRLLAHAAHLRSPSAKYSYRWRLEIERTIFCIAKDTAQKRLGFELTGFSYQCREAVFAQIIASEQTNTVKRILEICFEIRSLLGLLGSGEPYRAGEVSDAVHGGREGALRLLAKRLEHLAEWL